MHRPGRIGGDIFDIDHRLGFVGATSETGRIEQCRTQEQRPRLRVQPNVDETRSGDFGLVDRLVLGERGGDFDRELARIGKGRLGLLGIDHGGVHRKIAMREIARRLDDETSEIEIRRQSAVGDDRLEDRGDPVMEDGEDVHGRFAAGGGGVGKARR